MTAPFPTFAEFFHGLYGYAPYKWQEDLATLILEGSAPSGITVDTGLGKTQVISAWLWAFARERHEMTPGPRGARKVHTRLHFVVDRRLIVDDTAALGERIRARLVDPTAPEAVQSVASALQATKSSDGHLLDVVKLRGGMPGRAEHTRNIATPALITSTIDLFGSRLLWRGYGVATGRRSIDAALTGTDTLIVLDEAHLAPQFSRTMQDMELQARDETGFGGTIPARHFMIATATPLPGMTSVLSVDMDEEFRRNPDLAARTKRRQELPVDVRSLDKSSAAEVVGALATAAKSLKPAQGQAVAVFCNTVAVARAVFGALSKDAPKIGNPDIQLLIGGTPTPVRDEVLKALAPYRTGVTTRSEARPLYVVATQTLEVGADIDFDHAVSEMASYDSIIQRSGRVNRAGARDGGSFAVVGPDPRQIAVRYGKIVERRDAALVNAKGQYEKALASAQSIFARDSAKAELTRDNSLAKLDITSPSQGAKVLAAQDRCADKLVTLGLGLDERTTKANDALVAAQDKAHDECQTGEEAQLSSKFPVYGTSALKTSRWLGSAERTLGQIKNDFAELPTDEQTPMLSLAPETRRLPRHVLETFLDTTSDHAAPPVGAWIRPQDSNQRTYQIAFRESLTAIADDETLLRHLAEQPVAPWETWTMSGFAVDQIGVLDSKTRSFRMVTFDQSGTGTVIDIEKGSGQNARTILDGLWSPLILLAPDDDLVKSSMLPRFGEEFSHYRCQGEDPFMLVGSGTRAPLSISEDDDPVDALDTKLTAIAERGGPRGEVARLLLDTSRRITLLGGRTWVVDRSLATSEQEKLERYPLSTHLRDVADAARRLATQLGLPEPVVAAIELAAARHDLGKRHPAFQNELSYSLSGGVVTSVPAESELAKSDLPSKHRAGVRILAGVPAGFRHEGLSVALSDELGYPDGLDADLVRYLIATHHGHFRGTPPTSAADTASVDGTINTLQDSSSQQWHDWPELIDRVWSRYGPYTAALAEAIVRLADWEESAKNSKEPK